ncbi:MAG: zinc ribbon domain-containing protein [Deltaproteobacteria bacterium]|nr:zinc ribbon domain-containing protein [Deltaproteobacteria bacterium]
MPNLDVEKVMKQAWDLFTKDLVPLLVGSIIAALLSTVSLLILAPVLHAGLYKMLIRRVREGRPAEIGDVFGCFDQFGTLFVTGLVFVLAVAAASFLCVLPGIFLAIAWMYSTPLIVDKKMGMGDALGKSWNMVVAQLGQHIVMVIIMAVVLGVLNLTVIGSFFTAPAVVAITMAMYFTLEGIGATGQPAPAAPYPPAPSAPPAGPGKFAEPPPLAAPAAAAGAGLSQAGQEIDSAVKGFTQPPQAAAPQPAGGARTQAHLVCTSCSQAAPQAGAFCNNCGEPLKVACSACKAALVPGAAFCTQCGARFV